MANAIVHLARPTLLTPSSASSAIPAPDASIDEDTASNTAIADNLVGYVRGCFEEAREFRQREGINDSLLAALRSVRGEYDNETMAGIKEYGGSEIYARISANKVRAVAAMLREVYTSTDRPWALSPTSVPNINAPDINDAVVAQIKAEILELTQAGQQPDPMVILQRRQQLREQLLQARQELAADAAKDREDYLDDYLQKGGFYDAFWDFLLDLATFPFAVLKGPSVQYGNELSWSNNAPTLVNKPQLKWERASAFDVYFAPWSRVAQDGYILHYQQITRATLQSLKGLPSYNTKEIDAVLDLPVESFKEWLEYVETERANLEDHLAPSWYSTSKAIDRPYPMLEFHGPVSTKLLREWGMKEKDAPTDGNDIEIVAYLIGTHVIGVRKNPHPLGKKPFYVDSFERVPGSLYGLGVPGLIEDIQGVGNATLRALVNNMAIASGPQVGVNSDRMKDGDQNVKLWPWKVWSFEESLLGNGNQQVPMQFFQPESNAQELMEVFGKFMDMADTFSSLPRLASGDVTGAATLGRSAAGLSTVMNAANRTIKQVVTSIDNNVLKLVIEDLNVYVTLLNTDAPLDGDLDVIARGATELLEREALRQRRLEFLNVTNNPSDMALIGPGGRFEILREIARDLQLPIDKVFAGAAGAVNKLSMSPPGAIPAGGAPGALDPSGGPAPGSPTPPGAQPSPPGQQAPNPAPPGAPAPVPSQGMMRSSSIPSTRAIP